MTSTWAFIVLTHCANLQHVSFLRHCLAAIAKHYPDVHVYLLDDYSPLSPFILNLPASSVESVSVHRTPHPKAGEVNPYIFALTPECTHDRLIFIHDTVCVKPGLGTHVENTASVSPLWVSKTFLFSHTFEEANKDILDTFTVNGEPVKSLLKTYQVETPNNFFVTFGGMAIFTKEFVTNVYSVSNLEDTAIMFKERVHRCLWERILSVLIINLVGEPSVVCGDIQQHPSAFSNTNPYVEYAAPLVKCWQGR